MMRADEHLQWLVVSGSRNDLDPTDEESTTLEEAGGPGAEDVVGRVEAILQQMPDDEIVDVGEFRRALDVLLRNVHRTARKLDEDPTAPLDADDSQSLEAVVRTDGTRPSLPVRGDAVDPGHPLAGQWQHTLADRAAELTTALQAVGRIEPANATSRNFFGTGWVVDAGQGLVLTNLHVLHAMWRRLPHLIARTATGLRVFDGAYIDFVAETGSSRSRRFRIVEATPSGIDGPGFARLDVAVLKIEPMDAEDDVVPPPIPVSADPDGPKGNLESLCVIGFPGAPRVTSGFSEGVDWGWVNATLFGHRYGVKRLAPGITHQPLGSLAGDSRPWVFGHDATTLGGNSGSPTLAWGEGAFGLHFAGASVLRNCAHAVSACADELRALAVPVS